MLSLSWFGIQTSMQAYTQSIVRSQTGRLGFDCAWRGGREPWGKTLNLIFFVQFIRYLKMQKKDWFPTDHWNWVWICSLWQVVFVLQKNRTGTKTEERISEVIKALYTYTHSAQDVTVIEERGEEVHLRTNKKLWWAQKMSNRRQTKLSKQATTESDPLTQHAPGSFVMPTFKQAVPEEWREKETVRWIAASKLVTPGNTGPGKVMVDAYFKQI